MGTWEGAQHQTGVSQPVPRKTCEELRGGGQNIDKVLLKSLNIKIKNLMLNGSAAWLIYEF